MQNLNYDQLCELFGDNIDSTNFTWGKYCCKMGVSNADLFDAIDELNNTPKGNIVPLGWCDASKLIVRPQTEGVAIMFWCKDIEEETWCHISKAQTIAYYDMLELKKKHGK